MEKGKKIYEGKAKIIYETNDPDSVIQYFKDDATAFNAAKKGTVEEKGIMNNKISSKVFEFLQAEGIPTHFIEQLSEREMLIKRVEIVPVEVMAAWKPVFAYKWWWLLETVFEWKTWEFFKEKDWSDFVEKFELFHSKNKSWFYTKHNCINQAKKFDKEIFIKNIEKLVK